MATSIKDLTTIEYDIDDAKDSAKIIMAGVNQKRTIIRDQLASVEKGGDAWKHTLEELLPQLADIETMAWDDLNRLQATLREDAKHLDSVTYRCGLTDSKKDKAATRASQLLPMVASMSPGSVAAEIRSSLFHGDEVEMAAWAMLGSVIDAAWPPDQQVEDANGHTTFVQTLVLAPLREAQTRTGDKKVKKLDEELTTAIQTLTACTSSIAAQRNAHEPASFGSAADTFVFGQRDTTDQQRSTTRYDPAVIDERLKEQKV